MGTFMSLYVGCFAATQQLLIGAAARLLSVYGSCDAPVMLLQRSPYPTAGSRRPGQTAAQGCRSHNRSQGGGKQRMLQRRPRPPKRATNRTTG